MCLCISSFRLLLHVFTRESGVLTEDMGCSVSPGENSLVRTKQRKPSLLLVYIEILQHVSLQILILYF